MDRAKINNLIEGNRKSKKEELDLSSLNLNLIPFQIFELSHLRILRLENNNISEIPRQINMLMNLEYVYLKGNNIKEIPAEIAELKKLESIDVRDNPVINPPVEIVDKGVNVIRNYFDEIQRQGDTEKLFEAKILIVGQGGVGKTSLVRKLLNPEGGLPKYEETTKGIDITSLKFQMTDNVHFQANIWDFGGQEIYHSTHQFFLSTRSLYVMVIDTRYENTDFDYWLQVVEKLSDKSPILIVQNEKQDRRAQLNIISLKERYPNIIGVLSTNLMTNRGLPQVSNSIKEEIVHLPHIGSKLPKAWVNIRQELEVTATQKPFIDLNHYLEICKYYGISEKKKALFLSDFYHDLGVFLHFQDSPILKYLVILEPYWGTEAVYKVLDNSKVIDNYGRFNKNDLENIWGEPRYEGMQDELLELMRKFELCYQVGDFEVYIAPQLLKIERPRYDWAKSNNLSLKLSYDFLPKGIMSRFIVRMHRYINDQSLVWREGVILTRNASKAEVFQVYGNRKIEINVTGEPVSRKEFMTIILEEFDRLHESFLKLKVIKLIPCNCHDCSNSDTPEYYSYSILQKFIENGKSTIQCRSSFEDVPVKRLIGEFDPKFLPDAQDVDKTLIRIKRQIKSSFTDYLDETNE